MDSATVEGRDEPERTTSGPDTTTRGGPEDIAEAIRRQQEARFRNKSWFDTKHRLRPRKIEEGDWVIVYDSSLDHQHTTIRKFAKRWFGPYEVRKVFDNETY